VGLVYGRMSIGDLVRTTLSPDPDPGSIPYYTQTIGVTWATRAAATTVGATLAYQDTELDATHADRWTLDVGAGRAFGDGVRAAGMRVRIGRYGLSFARDAAFNDVGAAYRVGLEARLP